jgi:vacuolar iron transporter family protein
MLHTDAIQRYRENWQDEIDSAAQYRAMADGEPDDAVARVYRALAAMEDKHAGFWEAQLRTAGVEPGPRRPSWRARLLAWIARRCGAQLILPTVATREYTSRNDYLHEPETAATRMTAQERTHARLLQALLRRASGAPGSELARIEGRHRTVGGNALRAAVLGANDGLCSNLSLVMGVAGASVSGHGILVTGLAGLLAGACSMALGEWVSVTSARELADRDIQVERDELAAAPDEEREELQLIYEAKGLPADQAATLSRRLVTDPRNALDVLTREELGLDPQDLGGSARVAAATSFALFALGASVPVAPFFFVSGHAAVLGSLALSSLMLFGIGTAITVFTGRPVWLSGGRQLLLGLAAAGCHVRAGPRLRCGAELTRCGSPGARRASSLPVFSEPLHFLEVLRFSLLSS